MWDIWADFGAEEGTWAYSPYAGTLVLTAERQTISIEYNLYEVADITSYTITIDVPGPCPEPEAEPVVEEPVPGCDALIAIPSTAVGAKITTDTLAYWEPGQATQTVLPAGTSVRAIAQEDGWYEILYVCDFLYVPVGTIGPNPESPWFGAPLP